MIWWGLFLVAVSGSTFWLMISPIFMTFLLVKVSGVALLERDLAGRSEDYRDYIRRTSPFIPWPPKPSTACSRKLTDPCLLNYPSAGQRPGNNE